MKKFSLKNFAMSLCLVSILALVCSFVSELFFNFSPCKFCLMQRGIYLGIFVVASLIAHTSKNLLWLLRIILIVGLGIALSQTFIELALVDAKCTSLQIVDLEQFQESLDSQQPCQKERFLLGMPLAFYNGLIFLAIFILGFFVSLPQKQSRVSFESLKTCNHGVKAILLAILASMICSVCFGSEELERCQTDGSCLQSSHYPIKQSKKFYIFMDSDVPENIWLALSKDLMKLDGSFVLRGFPEGKATLLAQRIIHLREKGIYADISIDPLLFKRFNVKTSPIFVVVDGKQFDKISGSVSIESSLEQLANRGETQYAKTLLKQLRERRAFP